MEIFKYIASDKNKINDNIIEYRPNILSSDTPYYSKVVKYNDEYCIANKYINSDKKTTFYNSVKIKIEYSNSTGKINNIKINKNVSSQELSIIFKEIISSNKLNSDRFKSNMRFNLNWFKKILTIITKQKVPNNV